jgi:hypothetical protein
MSEPPAIEVPDALSPRGPVNDTPRRRAASVRRTTTIDMTWTGGVGSTLTLDGRGRDLLTPASDAVPVVLAEQGCQVRVASDRTIDGVRVIDLAGPSASSMPVPELVGARAGFGFRGVVEARSPDLVTAGTPFSLLLDDTPGATLISGWAFGRWRQLPVLGETAKAAGAGRKMEGICTGFMPGSSGLAPDGTSRWNHNSRPVRPLDGVDDPWAWHTITDMSGRIAMRRARRIDVWIEGGVIAIDSMFQDSSTTPEGGREAVHEYQLGATADLASGMLTSVSPVARVLPYRECPLAIQHVDALLGVPVADLRAVVLQRLKGVAGCTHLNDALRALADVPHLIDQLAEERHA